MNPILQKLHKLWTADIAPSDFQVASARKKDWQELEKMITQVTNSLSASAEYFADQKVEK